MFKANAPFNSSRGSFALKICFIKNLSLDQFGFNLRHEFVHESCNDIGFLICGLNGRGYIFSKLLAEWQPYKEQQEAYAE